MYGMKNETECGYCCTFDQCKTDRHGVNACSVCAPSLFDDEKISTCEDVHYEDEYDDHDFERDNRSHE